MDSQSSKGKKPAMEHDRTLADLPDGVVENILSRVGACNAKEVFRLRTMCTTFRRAVDSDAVYGKLEADSLFPIHIMRMRKIDVVMKMRENRNPHMLFRDGVNKLYFDGDEAAGKEMLSQAASHGVSDATFVLGMLLMGESHDKIEEAKKLLNDELTRTGGRWDVERTSTRVAGLLRDREALQPREFANCLLCCPEHRVLERRTLDIAWANRLAWLFQCKICLWEACYLRFKDSWRVLIEYEDW